MANAHTTLRTQWFADGHWNIDDDFPLVIVPAIIKDEEGNEEPDGLLPRSALDSDLEVIVPAWEFVADFTNTVVMSWRPAGMPFTAVQRFDFAAPVPPGDKTIKVVRTLLLQGVYELSYQVEVLGNASVESLKKTITIDVEPPDGNQKPKAVLFPDELNGVIDEDYLTREGEVVCTVPLYLGRRARDRCTYYWTETNLPPDGEPVLGEVEFSQEDIDQERLLVTVDAATIRASGNGTRYVYYYLRDRVGNVSPRSELSSITVDLTPLPENLRPARIPLSSRGLIDRQHAREGASNEGGVTVEIDRYDNASAGHRILINWDGTELAELPVDPAGFPLRAYVPWPTLVARGLGPMTVQVDYRLRRGAGFTPSPGPVSAPVDFTIAGQDHANAPALLNVNLERLEVRGQVSDIANTLTSADFGLDATATLPLFDDPLAGERIQVLWGRQQVEVANYTVQPGDMAGQSIRFDIPWAVIEAELINPALPVFYITDNGVNQQHSRVTEVNVNIEIIEGLKEPTFPHADFYGYLNCCSVPRIWEGVTVRIAGDPRFAVGDRIELDWQGCESLNGTRPIPGTAATFSKTLTADEAANGFDLVVLPFETLIAPMVNNASATAQYRLYKAGGGSGVSELDFVKISRTQPSGEVCSPDNDLCDQNPAR